MSYRASVPGGALTQDQQQQILQYMWKNPQDYDQLMKELRALPGITSEEIQLFESVDPSKVAAGPTGPAVADNGQDGMAEAAVYVLNNHRQ